MIKYIKFIMKIINKISILLFHITNLVLIVLYLYPGSILGCLLNNDCLIQPQIIINPTISINHLFAFIFLTSLGIFAYRNSKKIKFLITYLFLISIILELLHIIIPVRAFELADLIGNILGVTLILIIYKIRCKYAQS